jgi:hypothetical protein
MIKGRAETPAEKKAIIQRLLSVWISQPNLRLGQLLIASIPLDRDLFYMEDDELIIHIEKMIRKG